MGAVLVFLFLEHARYPEYPIIAFERAQHASITRVPYWNRSPRYPNAIHHSFFRASFQLKRAKCPNRQTELAVRELNRASVHKIDPSLSRQQPRRANSLDLPEPLLDPCGTAMVSQNAPNSIGAASAKLAIRISQLTVLGGGLFVIKYGLLLSIVELIAVLAQTSAVCRVLYSNKLWVRDVWV